MNRIQSDSEIRKLLVDYVDKNLPPIRSTVEMIPVSHEADELIYFHDPEGYLEKPFILNKEITALIPMLNGRFSIIDIQQELKRYGNEVNESQILAFIQQLDEARLLLSPWFRFYKDKTETEFEKSALRTPVCAGQTYPADPAALKEMLDHAFSMKMDIPGSVKNGTGWENGKSSNVKSDVNEKVRDSSRKSNGTIKALFAPHIDFRVGMQSYVPAFRPLADLRPERVVLLATSHYAGMFHPLYEDTPFIATRKDFKTPLGVIQTDQEALDLLQRHADECGCSFQDRAHRNEHSIELHLILLQYLWSHSFELVPLLVGSLEEMYYKKDGDKGKKVDAMAALLGNYYGKEDNTLFLISGDLSHVGHKFGDLSAASEMFDKIKSFDSAFLEDTKKANYPGLLHLMADELDPYRICGFPPLYTALTALPWLKGFVTSYDIWDEKERESAVSFASVLFHQTP